jgi:hypothetical protein
LTFTHAAEKVSDSDSSRSQVACFERERISAERLHPFRFVRHLPARCDDGGHDTGLRAGVGQTLGEETAGHAAVSGAGYGAMAIVGGASMLVAVARPLRWSIQPWQGQSTGPTCWVADGLVQLARLLRH